MPYVVQHMNRFQAEQKSATQRQLAKGPSMPRRQRQEAAYGGNGAAAQVRLSPPHSNPPPSQCAHTVPCTC